MGLFEKYLAESVGETLAARVKDALGQDAPTSVRLNPFKKSELLNLPVLRDVAWSPQGKILSSRPCFTLDPLMHAGAYYVQDSSAMIVGHVLRQMAGKFAGKDGICVLDLCAAPGGKTTDAAASLRGMFGDSFRLLANEVIRQRAGALADNASTWGDPAVSVCSSDAAVIGKALEGRFDIIIADVPCSGEGMFRKDEEAVRQWSPDNVELCAARQKRIISDVWPALKEGGILIYSTCTFNRRENDDNALWIAQNLGAQIIPPKEFNAPKMDGYDGPLRTGAGLLMLPPLVPGEGQWVCAMTKEGGKRGKDAGSWSGVNVIWDSSRKYLQKGRDRIPTADLVLDFTAQRGIFPEVELSRQEALRFLHKDSLYLPDAPRGFLTLTYGSLPLGLVKNLGTRANNLHPSSRRILMDINGK